MLGVLFIELAVLVVRMLRKPTQEEASVSSKLNITCIIGMIVLIICAVLMLSISSFNEVSMIGIIASAAFALVFLILTISSMERDRELTLKKYICNDAGGTHLSFFIIFGIITVLLAMPQVFGFTLKQASNDSFLRWQFNWDNNSDTYLWFYIKNLGLIFILMFPAFFSSDKHTRAFYGGGLLIWGICEFVLFQPNPYDNNKLLFVWFALTCGIVSNYMVKVFDKLNAPEIGESKIGIGRRISNSLLAIFVLTAVFLSGTLTICREYLSADHIGTYVEGGKTKFGLVESGYTVNTASEVKMAEWIKDNTDSHTIILTYNNHNNSIAMLTGRSIFVGSPTFLHWHGVNYKDRVAMLNKLYENPESCLLAAASEYGIEYVHIGSYARREYDVDIEWFEENLTCVYTYGEEKLFKIP